MPAELALSFSGACPSLASPPLFRRVAASRRRCGRARKSALEQVVPRTSVGSRRRRGHVAASNIDNSDDRFEPAFYILACRRATRSTSKKPQHHVVPQLIAPRTGFVGSGLARFFFRICHRQRGNGMNDRSHPRARPVDNRVCQLKSYGRTSTATSARPVWQPSVVANACSSKVHV